MTDGKCARCDGCGPGFHRDPASSRLVKGVCPECHGTGRPRSQPAGGSYDPTFDRELEADIKRDFAAEAAAVEGRTTSEDEDDDRLGLAEYGLDQLRDTPHFLGLVRAGWTALLAQRDNALADAKRWREQAEQENEAHASCEWRRRAEDAEKQVGALKMALSDAGRMEEERDHFRRAIEGALRQSSRLGTDQLESPVVREMLNALHAALRADGPEMWGPPGAGAAVAAGGEDFFEVDGRRILTFRTDGTFEIGISLSPVDAVMALRSLAEAYARVRRQDAARAAAALMDWVHWAQLEYGKSVSLSGVGKEYDESVRVLGRRCQCEHCAAALSKVSR